MTAISRYTSITFGLSKRKGFLELRNMPMESLESREQSLLNSARSGDASAVDTLLEAQRAPLTRFIFKRVRTREDCGDIVQSSLIRASQHITSFRGDCPFSQWVLRIAANELRNYYNRIVPAAARTAAFDEVKDFDLTDESDVALETAQRQQIDEIFALIKESCTDGEALVLKMIYQGESAEEIAELLGTKSATVRSQLLRGRAKLLAHIFEMRPEMVGGRDAIAQAIKKMAAIGEGLSEDELLAVQEPKRRAETYRVACLKIAKHVSISVALLTFFVEVTR